MRRFGWPLLPAALLLAALLLVPVRALAEASDPKQPKGRAAKVLTDKQYQTELPEDTRKRAKSATGGDTQTELPHERRRADEIEIPGSPIASALMWVIVGVAVMLLIVFVVRELGGYEKTEVGAIDNADLGPESAEATAAVVERPLDDAEALARSGRFGEAIHVLLLRTLEELMRRLDRPLPRSKTSREILQDVRLPDEARGALAHLVSAVEVSFFGGAEPGAGDYDVCRERFRRFADAYTRGVRA